MSTPEAYFLLQASYNEYLALPASLASAVLQHVVIIKSEYTDGEYVYQTTSKVVEAKVLKPEQMAAARAVERMAGQKP